MIGRTCVLLLCGGEKRKQSSDIQRARGYFKDYLGEGLHAMKDKTSESHDEVMRRRLRENPKFAAEYLKAALEDAEEPRVLLIALAPNCGSARRHCQGGQSCRDRA